MGSEGGGQREGGYWFEMVMCSKHGLGFRNNAEVKRLIDY
jgi:hypothetical protein